MAPDLDEIARRDERFHMTLERGPFVARNLENLQQLAHARRMMDAFAHQREHLVA
jgi:hypothetical protein